MKRYVVSFLSLVSSAPEIDQVRVNAVSEFVAARVYLFDRWRLDGSQTLADVEAFSTFEELDRYVRDTEQVIAVLEIE